MSFVTPVMSFPVTFSMEPSVNFDTSYSRIISSNTIESKYISDGFAIMTNGRITNLNSQVDLITQKENDIATKGYIDSLSSDSEIAPAPGKKYYGYIQTNGGANLFSASPNLVYSDFGVKTFNIYKQLIIGNIIITDNSIIGMDYPTKSNDAITLNYMNDFIVQDLITNSGNTTQLDGSLIINSILNRTININTGILQDILPEPSSIIGPNTNISDTFHFYYFYKGPYLPVYLLAGSDNKIVPMGYQYLFNTLKNSVTVSPNTMLYMSGICTGLNPVEITYFVQNLQSFYTENNQVSDYGLRTSKLISKRSITKSAYMIYSMVPTTSTSLSYTYTISDVSKILLLRNPPSNSTDTFQSATDFTNSSLFNLGYGSIKFTIQNISNYVITINSSSGFSGNFPVEIGPQKTGKFYILVNSASSCTLIKVGIFGRDGS
jgi:hypothetical protein